MVTLNLRFSECGCGGRRNRVNNKNEVFEYLIDQLRQQLPVADVIGEIKRWSIDRSIAGRGNYTDEENTIIDAYIGLEHNPYKQQCEDPAHEVLSLKNQLRDASAQIKELQKDNIKKSEHISHLTGRVKELHMALATATGDVETYKLIREQEQSGCRKNDTQECKHEWFIMPGLFLSEGDPDNVPSSELCLKCGKREWDGVGYKPTEAKNDTQECKHDWYWYNRWVK